MSSEIKNRETPVTRMRATPALSQMIDLLLADSPPGCEPTLGDIRSSLLSPHVFWSGQGELLYAQDQTALVIELDELIECHGAPARARDFVDHKTRPVASA